MGGVSGGMIYARLFDDFVDKLLCYVVLWRSARYGEKLVVALNCVIVDLNSSARSLL